MTAAHQTLELEEMIGNSLWLCVAAALTGLLLASGSSGKNGGQEITRMHQCILYSTAWRKNHVTVRCAWILAIVGCLVIGREVGKWLFGKNTKLQAAKRAAQALAIKLREYG